MTITETRTVETATVPCPSWCAHNHSGTPQDDPNLHTSDTAGHDVSLSRHGFDVLITVQQEKGARPFVAYTNHRSEPEYKLSPGEAEDIAAKVEEAISILEANGDHLCWCEGDHTPGDTHWGNMGIHTLDLYNPSRCFHISLQRDFHGPVSYVTMNIDTSRVEDFYTPAEAAELVALLRSNATIARGMTRKVGFHPEHPDCG